MVLGKNLVGERFLLCCDTQHTSESLGGEKTHTLTLEEMPSHNHKLVCSGGDTMAVITNRQHNNDVNQYGGGNWTYDQVSMYTTLAGDNNLHNNMPPYITCHAWKGVL